MDAATSQLVRQRAANHCEYCRLPEESSGLRFHIEHIVARQHGGTDDPDNLALACSEGSFHKGTNLTGIDPETGQVTRLFHPRRDRWEDHFARDEGNLVGNTAVGRTSVSLPEMNTGDRFRLRRFVLELGLLK